MTRNRRQNRVSGYDYSQGGYYFVTVCTQDRIEWFGEIKKGEMVLNDIGKMAHQLWNEIPFYYSGIHLDTFVVMPNHIHGIIIIESSVGTTPCGCPTRNEFGQTQMFGQTRGSVPTDKLSLSDVISRYKSLVTKKYIDGVRQYNWTAFNKKLWQRSFYDCIIRNETSLNQICQYITNNPRQWDTDIENIKNYGNKNNDVDVERFGQ